MPSFTKKAIMESFLRLMEKKPLDKITVRNLVDECGINRNTFYYYFQDIYAVLEEYCELFLATLSQESSPKALLGGILHQACEFSATHPRAAKSLAFSLGHEGLEHYLGARLEPMLKATIRQSTALAPSATLLHFLRHALIGLCLSVMRAEKAEGNVCEEFSEILDALFR